MNLIQVRKDNSCEMSGYVYDNNGRAIASANKKRSTVNKDEVSHGIIFLNDWLSAFVDIITYHETCDWFAYHCPVNCLTAELL